MAQGVMEQAPAQPAGSTTTKYVYFFGGGKADGNGKMKDVLGGKGAGLAEMTNAGLPVPPGFTIQTEACREYMRGKLSPQIETEMLDALERLEKMQGQKLGAGENPLLVSVRSGAKFSMPGMMDTILNLGLNDRPLKRWPSAAIIPVLLTTRTAASSRCSATWFSTFPRRSSSTSSTA